MSEVQIAIIDHEDTQITLAVPGVQGPVGNAIPSGGTTNQVLFKASATNYDATWGGISSAMITDLAIVDADINASAAIVDTKLATIATAGKVSNSATTATDANTASAIVARNASGNFTAGTITAALTGAASSNVLKAGDTMTGALVVPAGTVTANGIQVGTGTTYKPGIYSPGADQLAISTNGTGRLFVDASGNVGIGTTVPSELLVVNGATPAAAMVRTSSAAGNALIKFNADETNYAGIGLENAALVMRCSNNSTPTERARIDSSGRLLVGTSTTGLQNVRSLLWQGSAEAALYINHATTDVSGDPFVKFGYNGGQIGSITQSGTTAVLYNLTSDQRLKENIQDSDLASALIDDLQVRQFEWKSDKSHQRYGFVAQELVTVAPEAVHQPDNPDEMMGVDYSKLVPMLVKEVQSLRARLAAAGIA